jgi:essential nuclear protein 1
MERKRHLTEHVSFFFWHTCRVGQLLHSYRAGPLPKPFKIIPSLPAWARILALTTPEQWSPQAAHAATRIFISNMKPPQARVYLEGVILGLVRADLDQPSTRKDTRKLSPHLYEALKRALYKPAAFFKGIVFPLLDVSLFSLFPSLHVWTVRILIRVFR